MKESLPGQQGQRVFIVTVRRGHHQTRFGPFRTPELARRVGERWGGGGQVVVASYPMMEHIG